MRKLLVVEETLTFVQSQTHVTYSFVVSEQSKKLGIDFNYSPKSLDDERLSKEIIQLSLQKYTVANELKSNGPSFEQNWQRFLPLKNLITVSVDDPNGFRGACHRHDPEQSLYLTQELASPGLMPGPIGSGTWSVTLSIHALVTATCNFQLIVWEGVDTV
ncbi:hypothetical protein GK047_02130 [Paenibacillus sp. SYP-B3998]|uniref:Uncharacterized protein n=1 Tax=Paenibacillus sp. SYP-B3998 TaxID=2678564 RepID=A0A6G3ZRI0_9BACL|nr:hypothetical protein [Paenibacillus sp. SYP-B3998]NEW04816.1 hypothetical protein [Paenibacillus sp. SYP-B3998]